MEAPIEVMKRVQELLALQGVYHGKIDGDIGEISREAILKDAPRLAQTGWKGNRLATAWWQSYLNVRFGEALGVDGWYGKNTAAATKKVLSVAPVPAPSPVEAAAGWFHGVKADPRWNVKVLPSFADGQPMGVVLHRTAGHFLTGDYAVGKYGHYNGSAKNNVRGDALGFHFLIGKEPGEALQFAPVTKRLAHVKAWSGSYVGIELSGCVGNWKDGYFHAEPLTEWQLQTCTEVLLWLFGRTTSNCPPMRIANRWLATDDSRKQMHGIGQFAGVVCHRDLSGNDHDDGPRREDLIELERRCGK